jgi:NAD(P)-dependent dehydrogenase (short-subunit alcohol dehydrogenase family)
MTGVLQASFRLSPQRQAPLAEIQERVAPSEFRSQRALVVGGSRGLGEVVAKIVSAGGGAVCLSYCMGRSDAEIVARELVGETRMAHLDVTNLTNTEIQAINEGFGASHIYYFASPRILVDPSHKFDKNRFDYYTSYYVAGFVRLLQTLSADSSSKLRVFFPSTSFIDEPVPGALEYVVAKSAGEAACRVMAQDLDAEFLISRLPQLKTDQTASLLGVQGIDPILPMLEVVRDMNVL